MTCDDPNWPVRYQRVTRAGKRARLAEEVAWALKDAQAEVDATTGLLAKAEKEIKACHSALDRAGVPQQLPPLKTSLAPAPYRTLYLSAERDRYRAALESLRDEFALTPGPLLIVVTALDGEGKR